MTPLLFFLQMDLAVDPVYRRLYKFSQLIQVVSDAQIISLNIVEDIDKHFDKISNTFH